MEQAQNFLHRFQQAETLAEKETVTAEYKRFFDELEPRQQQEAITVMQILWPGIHQKVDELDALLLQAKIMLEDSTVQFK